MDATKIDIAPLLELNITNVNNIIKLTRLIISVVNVESADACGIDR